MPSIEHSLTLYVVSRHPRVADPRRKVKQHHGIFGSQVHTVEERSQQSLVKLWSFLPGQLVRSPCHPVSHSCRVSSMSARRRNSTLFYGGRALESPRTLPKVLVDASVGVEGWVHLVRCNGVGGGWQVEVGMGGCSHEPMGEWVVGLMGGSVGGHSRGNTPDCDCKAPHCCRGACIDEALVASSTKAVAASGANVE
jgi:hypothetical protein